jgi:60 kDa SS-A/Ro ribonucleoprotein
VLRKAHVVPPLIYPAARAESLAWAAGKGDGAGHPLLEAFMEAQQSDGPIATAALVREFRLPREALKPEHLREPEVWQALLDAGMPQTALMRNLATMTRVGLLTPFSQATGYVAAQLADAERLRKARVHPFQLLLAMKTYASGHGDRGRNTWNPVPKIIDALDEAFYNSFEYLEPTGKRFILGLDVSPSMHGTYIAGSSLTAAEGVGAMAMATAAVEEHMIFGFTHELVRLNISPRQRLDDIVRSMRDTGQNWGRTDAAQPILAAVRQKIEVDAFVTYTDNESWSGRVHPVQALRQYRQVMGIPAKLVVVGMTATRSTIGDNQDPATLDVVGFDSATPGLINQFVGGE